MSRGSGIIVSAEPKGRFTNGIIGASITAKPGIAMQIDPTIALVGGRHTFKLYDADADGGRPKGPYYILTENNLEGKTMTDAVPAGTMAMFYTPAPGDELNLLFGDIAGTGATSDITKGDVLIPNDADGKWLVTTGSPETEPAQALETYQDLTADQLIWCIWTGY